MFSNILFVLSVSVIGSAIAVCNLNGKWGPACKNPQMLPMNDAMKKAILDVHNKLRSDIANGKIPNYSKAANMKVLTWDQELTDRAALNVHQCEMKHDDCRSTSKHPGAGQNLAMTMTTGAVQKSPAQIAELAKSWFNEQKSGGKYGWMDLIKKFTTVGQGNDVVGHFTQFVWANTDKIGCAVSTSEKNQNGNDWKATWLACNYGNGNLIGAPVYEAGSPASKCTAGKSAIYAGLCN